MAMSSLAVTVTAGISVVASNTLTGSDYGANSNSTNIKKNLSIGTAAANAAAGGSDELYSAITSLAASASASIDLTSITDLLQTSGVSLARVKAIMIRVLSTTDDSSIGTAASSVKVDGSVTNGLVSQSGTGWLFNSSSLFEIPNGGVLLFATPTAGGVLVDGTHKVIKVTNVDGSVIAKVQVTVCGGSS